MNCPVSVEIIHDGMNEIRKVIEFFSLVVAVVVDLVIIGIIMNRIE